MKELLIANSLTLELNSAYAVGVDIGGTKINAGAITRSGEVLVTHTLPTLAGYSSIMERVEEIIAAVAAVLERELPYISLKGIGIGTAGQVDWANGSIRSATDILPGYTGTPIRRHIQERFGLPVYVDNDVNVLALTEKYLGVGRDSKHLICLALGTGVGGAVMIDGEIVHGVWGGAGEMGHLCVDFHGRPCVCGSVGCLEQYASGTAIATLMNEKLADLDLGGVPINSREVISRWLEGNDPNAALVMDEVIAALGAGVASLIHIFNPEVVIIGGGVAEAGEPLFARLRKEVGKRAMVSLAAGVRIEPAFQGNWSGMIGAGLQVWEYEDGQG